MNRNLTHRDIIGLDILFIELQIRQNLVVLEYFSIDNFGVISDKSYISINKLEPYNIKGQFNLKYIESGLIIEFKEDVFSGYLPTLEIESINNKKLFSMYRKNKNLLSSALIEPIKIKKISLIYDTNPEIVFEKQINNFLPNQAIKSYTYNNFIIKMDNSTFYNNGMIWIEEDNLKLNRNYNKISDIISIKPSNIPFKTLKCCLDVMDLIKQVSKIGNPNSISDAGVAAEMAHAGAQGAALNILINLKDIDDYEYCQKMEKHTKKHIVGIEKYLIDIRKIVMKVIKE